MSSKNQRPIPQYGGLKVSHKVLRKVVNNTNWSLVTNLEVYAVIQCSKEKAEKIPTYGLFCFMTTKMRHKQCMS